MPQAFNNRQEQIVPTAPVIEVRRRPSATAQVERAINTIQDLILQGHAVACGFSAGKDSTVVALLCLEAIRRVHAAGGRQATHYVSSAGTTVENPEVAWNLALAHEEMQRWAEQRALPLEVRMVEPAISARFAVSTIGRGTLPRFVENSAGKRACSWSWKLVPQQRLAKQLTNEAVSRGYRETVTVLGVRLDESRRREAAMKGRGDNAMAPVRNPEGHLVLSPIAEWTEVDVWDFLALFLDSMSAPFDSYVSPDSVRRLLDLYRDANEGTCGMFLVDGARSPCNTRFGCWTCMVTGDRDRSMESLLDSDPSYEYLRPLSDFRAYLLATQWDLSSRELVGRSLSPAGYVPVRPDVYSLAQRRTLLQMLITLDVLEEERAAENDAKVARGELPRTPYNLRMCDPQFCHVGPAELAAIDFYWGFHHAAQEAFPALRVWYDVRVLGRKVYPRKVQAAPATPIPAKRWFFVGAFDAQVPTDGLRDYKAELWNRYLHPERPLTHRMVGSERTAWFEECDGFEVDASAACLFVDSFCEGAMPIETQHFPAIDSSRFWLNEGIVRLPAGMAGRYQAMAKRGQYFAHLMQRLNVTPTELDEYLTRNAIDDQAHEHLCAAASAKAAAAQPDLFAAAVPLEA
jgi:DNA sulfur modification protein DndC